jgi:4-hydroxy-tetrahydrodipicolinate synthase
MSERIRGVLTPVVTPFQANLSPDNKRFIAHCKWLLSQNCGLAVFGTNSEANSLSMEERAMLPPRPGHAVPQCYVEQKR